jgi:branched-chain amino acid transport system ATP-binding protein
MSLLELENVVTAYGKVEALKGLTLRVEQGEIVALLSNGAGKSTTLRTISGLIRPRSGTMRFLGQPIGWLSPEAIVKLGVAHVPERRRLFPGLTVKENILLGGSNRARASRRELETEAEQMFVAFPELKPFANVLGWKLSGGNNRWWRSLGD